MRYNLHSFASNLNAAITPSFWHTMCICCIILPFRHIFIALKRETHHLAHTEYLFSRSNAKKSAHSSKINKANKLNGGSKWERRQKLFLAIATKATARSGNKATAIRIINWNSLFCVHFYFETAIKLTNSAVLFLLLKKINKSVKCVWFCRNKVFLHKLNCCIMELFILVTDFFASFFNSIQRVYFSLLQSFFFYLRVNWIWTTLSAPTNTNWNDDAKKNETNFRAVSKVTKCNFTSDREIENNNNNKKAMASFDVAMVDVTWHARTRRIQL